MQLKTERRKKLTLKKKLIQYLKLIFKKTKTNEHNGDNFRRKSCKNALFHESKT